MTSRLYSTFPAPTVGMFVPGLSAAAAHPVSVLTSVRNNNNGFRTNVGVYNPGPSMADPAFSLYDGTTLVGIFRLDAPLPPRTGAQINDVFAHAGAASLPTANGVVVVDGGASPLFSYAAVIDSATSDPIFVVGAEDDAPPPPAGSQTLVISVRAWDFSPGGPISPPMTLRVGTTYTLVFRNADLPGRSARDTGFPGSPSSGFRRPTTSPRGTSSSSRPSRPRPGSAAITRSSARRAAAAVTPSSTPE